MLPTTVGTPLLPSLGNFVEVFPRNFGIDGFLQGLHLGSFFLQVFPAEAPPVRRVLKERVHPRFALLHWCFRYVAYTVIPDFA